MDAVEYLKAKSRICKLGGCGACILGKFDDGNCGTYDFPEQVVEIVEKWSKEHPVKTYKDVFLEMLPKAPLNEKGHPKCCPSSLFNLDERCPMVNDSETSCTDCWNREYKEEEDVY